MRWKGGSNTGARERKIKREGMHSLGSHKVGDLIITVTTQEITKLETDREVE